MTGNITYLVAAYAVFGFSIVGLALSLRARQRRVEQEIGDLQVRLRSRELPPGRQTLAVQRADGEVPAGRLTI